jgi:hypothetical protein
MFYVLVPVNTENCKLPQKMLNEHVKLHLMLSFFKYQFMLRIDVVKIGI